MRQLEAAHPATDIAKVLKALDGVPYRFRIVMLGKVSAALRDKIKEYVKSLGVKECEISFPDSPQDLKKLAESTQPRSDEEVIPVPRACMVSVMACLKSLKLLSW